MSVVFRTVSARLFVIWGVLAAVIPAFSDEPDFFGNPSSGQRKVVGLNTSNCATCHSHPPEKENEELPLDVRSKGGDQWVLGNELKTWSCNDVHYQAFAVLLSPQAEEMAKRLDILDEEKKSNVHRDRRCLSCHSSLPFEQMDDVQKEIISGDPTRDSRFTIGVSCEACHGPAGSSNAGVRGWGEAHVSEAEWRSKRPREKFENFGYWDVHSIRVQTRICLSCHLGNVEQKKIITHEMYAAGHPTLPSFELSQFVHQMPRHWRRLDEKPKDLRDAFVKKMEPKIEFVDHEYAVTKTTVVAALVTLEESMKYTTDLIAATNNVPQQWPELANYSCFSCHHELMREGWRKSPRRLTTKRGRVPLHEWPFALSQAVNDAEDQNLKAKIDLLAAALSEQPYGAKTKLSTAALGVAETARELAMSVNSKTMTKDEAQRISERILKLAKEDLYDYDSARQLVWGLERIVAELETRIVRANNESDPTPENKELTPATATEALFKTINHKLSLNLQLTRDLNSQPKVKLYVRFDKHDKGFDHRLQLTNIQETLEKIAKFDPQEIKKDLPVSLNHADGNNEK